MKRITSLMAAMLLAGCGNHSTENQSGPVNPPAGEQPASPAETNAPSTSAASNSNPIIATVTNNPATNSMVMETNGPAATNQN